MDERLQLELRERNTATLVVETVLMILINTAAILGNLMVCWSVYNNKRLRTLPNMYVITLAISDITMGSLCMPLTVQVLITSEWTKSFDVCQYQGFFSWLCAFASIFTMTAMAINRYYRVVKPRFYGTYFTTKRVYLSLVVIFILASMGASMPVMFGWAVYTFHFGKVICFTKFRTIGLDMGYIVFLDALYISFPVLVISFCYLKIFKTVKAHSKGIFQTKKTAAQNGMPENSSNDEARRTTTRREERSKSFTINVEEVKITKTLFVTVLAFIMCWSPIAIIDMIDTYSSHTLKIPRQIYLVWVYMGYGSSSVNPFIYGILNRSFRTEFLKIFRFGRRTPLRVAPVAGSVAINTDWRPPPQNVGEIQIIDATETGTVGNN